MQTYNFPMGLGLGLVLLLVICQCLNLAKAEPSEAEVDALVDKVVGECAKEGSLTVEEGQHTMVEKSADMEKFSDKQKCFILCFYKKVDLIDAAGKPNAEAYTEYLESRFSTNKDKVKPAVAKCLSAQDVNPCEAIYKIEYCLVKNIQG